jgi:DNA-binding transcriptional LysR family regulator
VAPARAYARRLVSAWILEFDVRDAFLHGLTTMDASDLRMFEAVVRVGNITRASALLNTVQSNVTARIRSLEEELGVALLHRHPRGVSPTIAGQKLLPYAMRFAQLLEEARSAVCEQSTPHGKLVFGILETTAAMRLPPVVARYKRDFPEVDIAIRTGTTEELIDGVLQHKLEGAFVAGHVNHHELIEEVMFPEELLLIGAAATPPMDGLTSAHPTELLVLKSGCSYRNQLEAILTSRGILNFRILELGTIEAIVGLASAGIGISLLPRISVERAVSEGRISAQPVWPDACRVDTVFIRRADGFYSGAVKYLVEYMKASQPAEAAERSETSIRSVVPGPDYRRDTFAKPRVVS